MEPITNFYNGKTLFITGATGFIGKVLLEKLLYSCPGVKRIYIIVRQKRGKTVTQRMEAMWNLPLFGRLRKQFPETIKKVTTFEGDILLENYGLKPENMETLYKEVNIVFHIAATLKLEANLRDAVDMNTLGTWKVLKMAREMKQLEIFVHFSTAFCYGDLKELDEKVYDSADDPHEVMRIMTWMTDDAINFLSQKLLKHDPNTYTYSKRLSERLVKNEYPNLPVAIVRPSIVIPTWEEPVPGWVDTLNGPVGVMVGAGKGVIRSLYCDGGSLAEIIPVDYLVNAVINAAQATATAAVKPAEIPVYNITTNGARDTTWTHILKLAKETVQEYPLEYPLWYPGGELTLNYPLHFINVMLFHWLPAILIDFLLFIFRQKRFMIHVQTRISQGLDLLEYFTTRRWKFHNENFVKLQNSLTPIESKRFPLDFSVINDKEYIKKAILGGKEYCLKEKLENLPKARVVFKIMYVLDRLVKFMFFGYIFYLIYSYTMSWTKAAKALPGLGSFAMAD